MTTIAQIRHLHVGYRRNPDVLVDFDLDLEPTELVAVTGPSGRGKSSLLYAIGGLLRPRGGSIWIGGVDIASASERHRAAIRAAHCGFVFQDALLDPSRRVITSVTEVGLYRRRSRRQLRQTARDLLASLGVGHLANVRPGQMSGGQAQRVAVARALVGGPRIVLADEPTGNLDLESGRLVIDALRSYARAANACVVFATHDPNVVANVDREVRL